VLVGEQGRMKSMFINRLGMAWYSDSIGTVQGKEAFEALQGVWILELAELAQLKKAEVEQVKHFISKQEDRYRVAYGRRTENFPRQCIFFGTSNTKGFLRDATGNRRFWPIQIDVAEPYKNVADDMHQAEIDQIWAEAVQIYRKGEPLHLSAEVEKMAQHAQREHNEVDDRAGLISYYLSKPVPANWEEMDTNQRRQFMYGEDELFPEGVAPKQTVCAAEIWEECLNGNRKDMNTHSTKFIHDIMRNMPGWVELPNKIRFGKYGLQRGYARV
jgi:predicted P-loop ATPase